MSVRILSIESGADVCSVVLGEDEQIIACIEVSGSKAHAAHLPTNIDRILKENGLQVADLDAIAVSEGPGSYTGLRIGVSTAKGLCYAAQIPLIAVPSLTSIANNALAAATTAPDYICPMLDARRMEVYTTLFAEHMKQVFPVKALVIEKGIFDEYLNKGVVLFCGNGAMKTVELLDHPNARFMDHCISARGMVPFALDAFRKAQFADVAYFEPFYLKEFVALPSSKKLF